MWFCFSCFPVLFYRLDGFFFKVGVFLLVLAIVSFGVSGFSAFILVCGVLVGILLSCGFGSLVAYAGVPIILLIFVFLFKN